MNSYKQLLEIYNLEQAASIEPDLTQLKALSEGDQEFENEIVAVFLEEAPLQLFKLRKNSEQEHFDEIRKLIHKYKSSVHLIGNQFLSEPAQQIEDLLKGSDFSRTKVKILLDDLIVKSLLIIKFFRENEILSAH